VPFAVTRAERIKNHDPRLSLDERYASHSTYVKEVDKIGRALVSSRMMLGEDLDRQRDAAVADTLARLHAPAPKAQ
jgi:hypothetical protein